MNALSGRTAVVTGAGNGIGRAIATTFATAGAAIACLDLDPAAAEEAARAIEKVGGRAIARRCDVSVESDTRAAAEAVQKTFGAIHVLVNAAATDDPNGNVLDTTPADWNRVLAVNVTGAYLMSRAVMPSMIAAGGGSIIHIASQLGRVAAPARAAYCTSKGAIIQLARAMAVDHAAQNIRVNALSPGAVETRRLVLRFGDMETARRTSGPKHLLNRLGQPDEIAQAALFLASDAASFMTGADMLVDGGYTTT
ncbi:MAG TPA: glucose 1-dehydrogenase [Pseudolabrys sp.]|nr:glucose 1-dehydrogenase [Pseudolabrys sp.]